MARSLSQLPERVERKPLKCSPERAEVIQAARKKVSPEGGQVTSTALEKAGVHRGEAAHYLGISEGLLSRQIENTDNQHLSFQRMWDFLPPHVWMELVFLIVERKNLGEIRRRITFELGA